MSRSQDLSTINPICIALMRQLAVRSPADRHIYARTFVDRLANVFTGSGINFEDLISWDSPSSPLFEGEDDD